MATSITPHSYTADGSKTPPPAGTLTQRPRLQAQACRKISLSRLLHSGAPPARLRSRARSEPPHGADPLSRSPSPPRGRVSRWWIFV